MRGQEGQRLMNMVLQREGWKFKISLDLRRGCPIKSLTNLPRLVMIGCLTLNPKRLEEEINQKINQLIRSVVRSIRVSDYL